MNISSKMTNKQKEALAAVLIRKAGDLVEFFEEITEGNDALVGVTGDQVRRQLSIWLGRLPGDAWDTRLQGYDAPAVEPEIEQTPEPQPTTLTEQTIELAEEFYGADETEAQKIVTTLARALTADQAQGLLMINSDMISFGYAYNSSSRANVRVIYDGLITPETFDTLVQHKMVLDAQHGTHIHFTRLSRLGTEVLTSYELWSA